MTKKPVLTGLEEVYRQIKDASGVEFGFSRPDDQTHQNSYTFYLWYKGPLPDATKPKEVKVDITVQELLIYVPVERQVIKTYAEYDIPEAPTNSIFAYALEEVVLEKSMALLDPARCEPRDLYDLWYLTTNEGVSMINLSENMQKKLLFKKKRFMPTSDQLEKKKKRLAIGWEKRLKHQMVELPEFEGAYRAVSRSFRQALI
ncbi:MAG: nucleotidyl transferase AbiEii/AbiGii toxin family protein [Deltaproteobacteria bacterium]|nr:nucleotidyl transferase AbiEii/AbiGii toxin family protein [Deltaproteobacteria bacterium]